MEVGLDGAAYYGNAGTDYGGGPSNGKLIGRTEDLNKELAHISNAV